MSHEKQTIGERLRLERERLKLSQAHVSGRLHVARATYIKYENGETDPNAWQLSVLDRLGFDIYFIVVGERSANELGAELCNLFAAYNAASAELKAAAFGVLLSAHNEEIGACQVVPGHVEKILDASLARKGTASGQLHPEVGLKYKQGPIPTRLLQDADSDTKEKPVGE